MRDTWEKIKFVLICYLAIAVILLVCAFGFSWVLRLFSSGIDRGMALVAGAILAVGSIDLLARLMVFAEEHLGGDLDDDDGGGPDEPPVIVVPPEFPYRVRQSKRHGGAKKK